MSRRIQTFFSFSTILYKVLFYVFHFLKQLAVSCLYAVFKRLYRSCSRGRSTLGQVGQLAQTSALPQKWRKTLFYEKERKGAFCGL